MIDAWCYDLNNQSRHIVNVDLIPDDAEAGGSRREGTAA